MFPPHIGEILNRFGVRPDTKAALYELYVGFGNEVLERFADLCADLPSPSSIHPEDMSGLRASVVDHFVRDKHWQWMAQRPTASLWHPRDLEGRAAGLALPLGLLGQDPSGLGSEVTRLARQILGPSQPIPEGVLMLGKNAHSGGRNETISFDVIAADLNDALAIAHAAGQQHTLPGSVGETSGTIDAIHSVSLLWEIQPNVLKPSGERNRAVRQVYRRHRNWHVLTLLAAILWLQSRKVSIYVVQGQALPMTHELNPAVPISATVMALHDRTVRLVVESLGGFLVPVTAEESRLLLETEMMNTSLSAHVRERGGANAVWKVVFEQEAKPLSA
jgi:hypothetical protein